MAFAVPIFSEGFETNLELELDFWLRMDHLQIKKEPVLAAK